MTVYIGSAAFVAQLQQERDKALAENLKLRAELAALRGTESKPTGECVICGIDANGGTYGELFPLCFDCYNDYAEDVHKYVAMLEKGKDE